MKRTIERFIGKLKNDPTYKLDNNYSTRQLFFIVWYRLFQLLRGFVLKLRVSTSGLVFCGKRVIIQHGYQVRAGKSLIVEDGVHINGLSAQGIVMGNNVTIGKYAILVCTGVIASKGVGISIGNNSAVGAHSFLSGQGGIRIGENVIMGPGVRIFAENHNFRHPEIPIMKQGVSRQGVVIDDNCWLGAGATVLDGVTIQKGCVVAAGAVVTKSLPENTFAAGVPARVIGNRSSRQNT